MVFVYLVSFDGFIEVIVRIKCILWELGGKFRFFFWRFGIARRKRNVRFSFFSYCLICSRIQLGVGGAG